MILIRVLEITSFSTRKLSCFFKKSWHPNCNHLIIYKHTEIIFFSLQSSLLMLAPKRALTDPRPEKKEKNRSLLLELNICGAHRSLTDQNQNITESPPVSRPHSRLKGPLIA